MDPARQEEMLRLFGEYTASQATLDSETKRNTDNAKLFEAILREVYPDITFVAAGHHVMFMREGQPLPGEVASADTLIFDHAIAKKIWGDTYKQILSALALVPAEGRDAALHMFYYGRPT
jgi:hypothetical protein